MMNIKKVRVGSLDYFLIIFQVLRLLNLIKEKPIFINKLCKLKYRRIQGNEIRNHIVFVKSSDFLLH